MLLTYTAGNSQTNKASNDMSNTQTHKILTDKPVFLLEITKSGAPVKIDLNGMQVYTDRSDLQEFVVYPLNDKISSGKNLLDIYIIAPEYLDYSLPEDAFLEVKLIVQNSEGKEFTIDQVSYRPLNKEPLLGSSEKGRYSFVDNEFVKSTSGEIEIGQVRSANLQIIYGEKMGGIKLSQAVSMQTPFPRWKFLDSENIIEQDFLTMSAEEVAELKNTDLIQDLYKINLDMHEALKTKNIDLFIDYFDERSFDKDVAFYNPEGQTKEGFYQTIKEKISEADLLDINPKKRAFYIESNRKVAYLYKAFRFKNHDESGFTMYSAKFRLENGKWIVTR